MAVKIRMRDKLKLAEKSRDVNSEEADLIDTIDDKKTVVENTENQRITISVIKRDIDLDKYSSLLKYKFKDNVHEIEVSRVSYLTKKGFIDLLNQGLSVTEYNVSRTIMDLLEQEKRAPVICVHSKVGSDVIDGKLVFKHFGGINIVSSYNGKLDIKPKGSYENWLKTIIDYVIGNTALEVMLVIGFSSAIVGLLSLISDNDSLLVHLSGDSTTGKTTGSMLPISIWGNPSTKITNGLASTWNATENSMFTNIVGNNGLAVLFDEVSMNDSLDFTKFIYKFTGNKDKRRLNKESKVDDIGTWGSTFISNGEFSLLEKSKKNTGAQLRVIDFHNVLWTKDAESSEAILQSILQNYGHAGVMFVRHLLKSNADTIYNEILELKDKTIEEMKEKGIQDKYLNRRAWKYNILMYTALKVQEFLNIPLGIDEIWDFLMDNEKHSISSRDLKENAFEYFIEMVNINYKKFLRSDNMKATNDEDVKNPNYEIMGKIYVLPNKPYNEICIFPNLFKEMMKDGGFEDSKIILKSWKEQKILDCEVDRLTRKRNIIESGGAVPVYVIRVDKDKSLVDDDEEQSALIP
jgi:putative DNA primase/helicase